jgi:hypothetical protein
MQSGIANAASIFPRAKKPWLALRPAKARLPSKAENRQTQTREASDLQEVAGRSGVAAVRIAATKCVFENRSPRLLEPIRKNVIVDEWRRPQDFRQSALGIGC